MSTMGLSRQNGGKTKRDRLTFWKRQFAPTQTTPQIVFDIVFGVVAPILCFYFDPIVFKSDIGGPPLLNGYQVFVYSFTAIQVTAMLLWVSGRLKSIGSILGGILLSGSAFSAVIGFAILPYSLIGLVIIIGVFGFTPFLTAFIYLRGGWRALRADVAYPVNGFRFALMTVGIIVALGLPMFARTQVSRTLSNSIDAILYGPPSQAEMAVNDLKWLPFIPQGELDQIVQLYQGESDQNRKARLKKYYQDLTGVDLEERMRILND